MDEAERVLKCCAGDVFTCRSDERDTGLRIGDDGLPPWRTAGDLVAAEISIRYSMWPACVLGGRDDFFGVVMT